MVIDIMSLSLIALFREHVPTYGTWQNAWVILWARSAGIKSISFGINFDLLTYVTYSFTISIACVEYIRESISTGFTEDDSNEVSLMNYTHLMSTFSESIVSPMITQSYQ